MSLIMFSSSGLSIIICYEKKNFFFLTENQKSITPLISIQNTIFKMIQAIF